jgi:uncharacterized OB-fold protein
LNNPVGNTPQEPTIQLYKCSNGHAFLHRRDLCPDCGKKLVETRTSARARLITHTVVRVKPGEGPLMLGIAETETGAKTLCVVEERPVKDGDGVTLVWKAGIYHAAFRSPR